MASSLYSFGPEIVFSPGGIDASGMDREREYRQQFTEVAQGEAKRSYAGRGQDLITFTGVTFPGQYGDTESVERLDEVAATGTPQELARGDGRLLGKYVILSVSEEQEFFMSDGTPRRISYTVRMRKDREGV